ncbi:MAG TPA: ABC transporter permease subunit [Spirochaetia bacterium]|nr:ABC transporter permease subunit [Spirochaetia bacterium]
MKTRRGLLGDILRNPASYLLALPAIAYTLAFSYLSYPYLLMAFQRFNYRRNIWNAEYIGLTNFQFFFRANYAYTITWNTLKLNTLFIVFTTVVALLLALMLNELASKRFVKVSQSTMVFPTYLSWVVVSYMLFGIFSMEYGLLNRVLVRLGGEAINWYIRAEAWPAILTGMRVWKGAGLNAVIFLAAIAAIDDTLYEAASIDGASRWQRAWTITLPLIAPTVAILTLMAIGRIMYGDFGMIYALIGDNGPLYPTTDVIDTYVYRALRKVGDPAEATAIGLFQSAVGFVMVIGANTLTRKLFPEGALY